MKQAFSRVFIKDEEGNILVIKEKERGWNFPGGKEDEGETAEECAIRETQEEIGLTVSSLETIFKGELIFKGVKWESSFFFAHQVKGKPTFNEKVIKGIEFVEDFSGHFFSEGLDPLFQYLEETKILENKTTSWED